MAAVNTIRFSRCVAVLSLCVPVFAWAAPPTCVVGAVQDAAECSRAAQGKSLAPETITPRAIESVKALDALAQARGQTLAQMAIAWVLRGGGITTALIGASKPEQVVDCAGAVGNLEFTAEELAEIDRIAAEEDINLWARSSETE